MYLVKEWSKAVFSKNLKKYMAESGKTQRELADVVGVSAPTFNEWVNGKKFPRIDRIQKLADYFGIMKSDLIEDKQKQSTEGELSIIKKEFIRKVEGMTDAQIERLEQNLALVENTE